MTDLPNNRLLKFTPRDAAKPIPGAIEREMPLLSAIAREICQADGDFVAKLPTARKLLQSAFQSIDSPRAGQRLVVA